MAEVSSVFLLDGFSWNQHQPQPRLEKAPYKYQAIHHRKGKQQTSLAVFADSRSKGKQDLGM